MKGRVRIYYGGDYLTIFIGESKPNYREDITDYVTVFKDNETEEVIGVGILNFKDHVHDLNEILSKIPLKINFEIS